MSLPYIPYQAPRFSDLIGIAASNLDAQLAREKAMIDDARAKQLAAMEERNRERQHQQQMAQFSLNEMKFNYEKEQDQVGGLKYEETMARIGQYNAGADENQAQANYYKRRAENPEAFRTPGAAARPRVIPLTAGQIKANADAAAMGQPPPYKVTVVNPGTGAYGSDYTNANVNDPNDPALSELETSIEEQSTADNPYVPGPVANDPVAGELPSGQGGPEGNLLNPDFIPPANPGPPAIDPQSPAPLLQPGDVLPVPTSPILPTQSQGALPMDPASIQRRQAMEYERIKEQAAVSAALNRQKADAAAALAIDDKDPVALAQKAAADAELKKLFATPPKATVVQDEPTGESSNPPGYGVRKPQDSPAPPPSSQEINPSEVPSLRERNTQNANAKSYAAWTELKENTTSDLPKAFTDPELKMVIKSIKRGEEDELASELANRGSSLVEVVEIPVPGSPGGFREGGVPVINFRKKAVFKRLKAPNGEMINAFKVLQMTYPPEDAATDAEPQDAGPKVQPMADDVQKRVDETAAKYGL